MIREYPIDLSDCFCAKCGPPWRFSEPEPDRETEFAAWLAWGSWMALCPRCGYKRCPGAADHENECTRSNAFGQPGSLYEDVKPRIMVDDKGKIRKVPKT